ncbi:DMT family transporter [Rhodosalinus sp. K401]|uniref:DMT family transporter n=1 Tax=Rhodosalinus sp. K401 TaxID=3239195 RepID=UPI003524338A
MQPDRPLLGILLMLGFCALAPLGDAVAKILGGVVPLGMLLLARFGIQAAILLPIVAVGRRPWRMRGRVLALAWARTLLHIAGIAMMFSALRHLPLADAIAIAYVMPFILLLLGWAVMGEEVGWRRLAACVAGFAGTLLVIRPSFQEVGWPALLPVGVAVGFALFMLVTRAIARQTDPLGLQAVSGVMATALLLPALALVDGRGVPALRLVAPPSEALSLLLLLGVLGTLAHLCMTWALRFAPSATLAPMQYIEIPFATLFGWAIFRDLPDGMAAAGILVTMAAGLYVLMRERAIARAALAAPPPRRQGSAGAG